MRTWNWALRCDRCEAESAPGNPGDPLPQLWGVLRVQPILPHPARRFHLCPPCVTRAFAEVPG